VAEDLKPDLLFITESWCNDNVTNAYLTIPGYQLAPDLRYDRADTCSGIGGGLLVYAKTGMQILSVETNVNFNQHVGFKLVTDTDTLNFILIYRPPRHHPESMINLAQLIRNVPVNTVMVGDFNLPGLDWVKGEARGAGADEVLEACNEKFLEQLVDFPTHLKGNTLDLILTNVPERFLDISNAGRLGTSDHYMILAEFAIGKKQEESASLVRNWWKADWEAMKQELSRESWEGLDQKSASEAWQQFKDRIENIVERHVPMKPRGRPGRPPWMTREILRAVRRKRRIWKKEDGRNISQQYRETERKVRNLIRNAKRNLERKLATENNGNSKPFYAYLKSKTKNRSPVGPLKDGQGSIVSDKKKMAEMLNSYFSSVFTVEGDEEVPKADNENCRTRLTDIQIDEAAVSKKIKDLKATSSPGPDGIGSLLIKTLQDQITAPLTTIFRTSVRSGDVPEDWRMANVTPIYKKGAKTDPANYRPVSLTAVSCKILESLIRDEIVGHMSENGLIEDSQHGFVKGRSCGTNLVEFFDYISSILDSGGAADSIFLDFAKAFDKVPKNRLLEKMRAIGIGGNVLNWVSSWLTGRKQQVVLDGNKSQLEDVVSGVPQGSVLGPVLFLIFIRDLDRAVTGNVRLRKFADDTKIANRITGAEDSAELQRALDSMMEWARKWGMEFNPKKCKVMHFGLRNARHQYTMGGHILEETNEEKDVGVTITSDLKPSAQCCRAAKTASTVLGQIGRSFKYRDRNIFPKLYMRYVRPHLEFSSIAWSPWLQKDIEQLERVQKRAVNMVNGLKSDVYEEKLLELGMESLADRRKEADLTMMYKILNGKCNVTREHWAELSARTANVTRAAADEMSIKKPFARTEKRANFYTVRIADMWNALPKSIRNSKNVSLFKSNYRKYKKSSRRGPGAP
jgi:Reverse transcriptase (RNA-dependent DNA polymerase)/Endonuclease-reverse transcriptase